MNELLSSFYRLQFRSNRLYEEYAKTVGESAQTLYFMQLISGVSAPMCQRDLCESLSIPKQTMSRMIKQLQDRGLVEVSPSKADRRETGVSLTEEGASYAEALIAELSRIEGECVKAVGREAIEQVSATTRRFFDEFEGQLRKIQDERGE